MTTKRAPRARLATKKPAVLVAPPPAEAQRLPVVRTLDVGPNGVAMSLEVFCPAQEATVPAERCAGCGFMSAFPPDAAAGGATVECTPPQMGATLAARSSPRIDMGEAATRVALGELVPRTVVCVSVEAAVDAVTALLLEHALAEAPVVDSDRRPVGYLTTVDSARASGQGKSAFDVMAPLGHTLPERARLSHAMALMAAESTARIAIVKEDGTLAGMISALDCVTWMARQMGY